MTYFNTTPINLRNNIIISVIAILLIGCMTKTNDDFINELIFETKNTLPFSLPYETEVSTWWDIVKDKNDMVFVYFLNPKNLNNLPNKNYLIRDRAPKKLVQELKKRNINIIHRYYDISGFNNNKKLLKEIIIEADDLM